MPDFLRSHPRIDQGLTFALFLLSFVGVQMTASGLELARKPADRWTPREVSSALRESLLETWLPEDPALRIGLPESENPSVTIDYSHTYRVCVRSFNRDTGGRLYRYERPFWWPALIKRSTFSLATGIRARWILDPATVRCPFPLVHPAARYGNYEQKLDWGGTNQHSDHGRPALPGHGITYSWRDA